MKKTFRVLALAGVLALAATACGEAPEDDTASGGGAASDFQACMVTDSGGIDDRSFNASAWAGMERAGEELGIEAKYVESNAETDFTPNVNQLVQDDCGIIVTVGFLLGDATKEAAEANPDEQFAIVDFTYDEPVAGVKPLVFDTAQASFLAGYLAAGMTETGKVATFGGINLPTVSIFMDGFYDGVQHHNTEKGTAVGVLGWDKAAQNGSFTGDFQDQNKGKQLTQNFIQQGADIILPVAGPVGLGAAAAAQESGNANLIWVDTDGFESAPQYGPLFISSVVKEIDNAVFEVTQQATEDTFSDEVYVGTLDNEGVSLAPFHDFDSAVSDELKGELDDIKQAIIDGDIVVESPSSPQS